MEEPEDFAPAEVCHAARPGTIRAKPDACLRSAGGRAQGDRLGAAASSEKCTPRMRRPVAAVVLHLRSRYVSKAAIFRGGCRAHPLKIEVPLEFQGLGSLGAAHSGDGFSLADLTPIKSLVQWLLEVRPSRG